MIEENTLKFEMVYLDHTEGKFTEMLKETSMSKSEDITFTLHAKPEILTEQSPAWLHNLILQMLYDPMIFPFHDQVEDFLESFYWFTKITDEATGKTWEVAYKKNLQGWFNEGIPFEDDVHIYNRKKTMEEIYDFYLSNSTCELADKSYNDWAYHDGMSQEDAYQIVLSYLGDSYTGNGCGHKYVKTYLENNPEVNEFTIFTRVAYVLSKTSQFVDKEL